MKKTLTILTFLAIVLDIEYGDGRHAPRRDRELKRND
jgi:hypothetical protein